METEEYEHLTFLDVQVKKQTVEDSTQEFITKAYILTDIYMPTRVIVLNKKQIITYIRNKSS